MSLVPLTLTVCDTEVSWEPEGESLLVRERDCDSCKVGDAPDRDSVSELLACSVIELVFDRKAEIVRMLSVTETDADGMGENDMDCVFRVSLS